MPALVSQDRRRVGYEPGLSGNTVAAMMRRNRVRVALDAAQ